MHAMSLNCTPEKNFTWSVAIARNDATLVPESLLRFGALGQSETIRHIAYENESPLPLGRLCIDGH
jgi:hypothetical protein